MFLLRLSEKINTILFKVKMKVLYQNRVIYKSLRIRGAISVFLEDDARVEIGGAFFNRGCSLNAHKLIRIGNNCIFGENVKIYDHNHLYKSMDIPISQQGFSVDEVVIGDNCWIGSNVTILKGVTIGDNVIIGANCLIYKDVPANTVVKLGNSLLMKERV